jgi:hypothetical protein
MCSLSPGVLCPFNSSVPYVKAGWYRSLSSNVTETIICIPTDSCLEAGYGSTNCSSGYDGKGCLLCADQFYRLGTKCLPCLMKAGRWFLLCIMFLLSVYGCWRLTVAHHRIPNVAKIAFNWIQFLSLYSLISSSWPKSLNGFFNASLLLNGDIQLFGFDCDKLSYWSIWLMKLLGFRCYFYWDCWTHLQFSGCKEE